jgi:aminopeptidase N
MFPLAGNGGYDVSNYSLTLDYTPSANRLVGTVVITARATQNLSRFDLDFRMQNSVTRLLVNGAPASFSYAEGQELVVTPATGLVQGKTFTVSVDYAGQPVVVTDPDTSIEGWVPTEDGAFVVNEPQGSPGWYPVNDNPRDKAAFDFSVTVPEGLTVMANGVLVSETQAAGKTTWVWRESEPMAPYLATATLGNFDLTTSTTDGIPTYVAVDPQLPKGQVLSKLPTRSVLQLDLRAVPVQRGRRHRRQREVRRLLTRDADEAELSRCPTRRLSFTSSRTCGSATR